MTALCPGKIVIGFPTLKENVAIVSECRRILVTVREVVSTLNRIDPGSSARGRTGGEYGLPRTSLPAFCRNGSAFLMYTKPVTFSRVNKLLRGCKDRASAPKRFVARPVR